MSETQDACPSPGHISYDEDSRWCYDHGHTGLLVGSVCDICDRLVAADPRFAAVLDVEHDRDGSRHASHPGAFPVSSEEEDR